MFFIEPESVLSVIADGQQQSTVNKVPVKALWNVWLAAGLLSTAQPVPAAATVAQCLKKWKIPPTWTPSHWWSPARFIHQWSQVPAHKHRRGYTFIRTNTNTDTRDQTRTTALCPIDFAGPVAEHNEVFTLRHSNWKGWWRRMDLEWVWVWHRERRGRKEKRHSMIMYELSAVLHGWRNECSGAFKKKIIMSRYSNTSLNTDFHWVLVLCFICLSVNSQSG